MIWDEAEIDNDDDDIMEEACVGHDYNLCSKGTPKSNDSPFASKTVAKRNSTIVASKETLTNKFPKKEKEIQREESPNKSPIILDLTQNIPGDLKLDYVVAEDLKKMKANITIFELCKIKKTDETFMWIFKTHTRPLGCGNR